jgi:hypothetical protein
MTPFCIFIYPNLFSICLTEAQQGKPVSAQPLSYLKAQLSRWIKYVPYLVSSHIETECCLPRHTRTNFGTEDRMNFQEGKNFTSRSLASLIKERDLFSPDTSCKQFILFGQSSTQKKCFASKDLSGKFLAATIKDEYFNDVNKGLFESETILSSEMVLQKSEITKSSDRPTSYAGAVLRSMP